MASEVQNNFSVIIKWRSEEREIKDLTDDTKVLELKVRIYEETGIRREKQTLRVISTGKLLSSDEETLGGAGIAAGDQLIAVDAIAENSGAQSSAEADPLLGDYEVLEREHILEPEFFNQNSIEELNPLREGKKLLFVGARPELPFYNEFLTRVYKHYDIVVWKEWRAFDRLRSVWFNVADNPHYKITAGLDHNFLVPIWLPNRGVVDALPLEALWQRYPQHSAKDTAAIVYCNQVAALNPQSALLIKCGFMDKVTCDLVNLATYLESISEVDDFRTLDHTKWRESIAEVDIDPVTNEIYSVSHRGERRHEDYSLNNEEIFHGPACAKYYLEETQKTADRCDIVELHPPGRGKHLLILNFEYILYDPNYQPQTDPKALRPFLREFLAKISKYFDIAIWTGGRRKWIEEKLKSLGLLDDEKFKINFILDYTAETTLVTQQNEIVNVKSLDLISKKYPQYSYSARVIDADVKNVMLHPDSVVTIKPMTDPEFKWEDDKVLQKAYEYIMLRRFCLRSWTGTAGNWEDSAEVSERQKRERKSKDHILWLDEMGRKAVYLREQKRLAEETHLKYEQSLEGDSWSDVEEEKILLEEKEIHFEAVNKMIESCKIEEVNPLREDKKLLVIDIDFEGCGTYPPYFCEFLTRVNRHYNIVMWSERDKTTTMMDMKNMSIQRNPNFEISFYLCYPAVLELYESLSADDPVCVKPLQLIWQNYPNYSAKNTVIVSDSEKCFVMNPQSGLICETIKSKTRDPEKDKVMGKLADYLETIANIDDFRKLDHGQWHEVIIGD